MGYGLGLNETSKGTHVIVCGGTGICAFLDLLDLLFKKCFLFILKDKIGLNIDINFEGSRTWYEKVLNNFRVILFAAFPDK
jgi:hypothetical protein